MTDSERAHLNAQTTRFFGSYPNHHANAALSLAYFGWVERIVRDYHIFLRKGDEQAHTGTTL
jgi:hypothetical protein